MAIVATESKRGLHCFFAVQLLYVQYSSMWSALRYVCNTLQYVLYSTCTINECSDTTPAGSVFSRLICENLNPFSPPQFCYNDLLDFLMYVFSSIKISTRMLQIHCQNDTVSPIEHQTHLLTLIPFVRFFLSRPQ